MEASIFAPLAATNSGRSSKVTPVPVAPAPPSLCTGVVCDTRYLAKGPLGTPSGFGFIKPDTGKTGEGGLNLRIDDFAFCCIHDQVCMLELIRVVFLSANSYTLAFKHTCLTPSTLFLGP